MSSTRTLGALIRQTGREAGVEEAFVEQLLALFTSRDIALDSPGEPWEELVRETIERHVDLGETMASVQRTLGQLEGLYAELRERAERLQEQARRLEACAGALREPRLARSLAAAGGWAWGPPGPGRWLN